MPLPIKSDSTDAALASLKEIGAVLRDLPLPLEGLQRTFKGIGGTVKDVLLPALEAFRKATADVGDALKATVPGYGFAVGQLKKLGESFKDAFRENIGLRVGAAFKGVKDAVLKILPTSVIDGVSGAAGKVGKALGSVGKAVGAMATAAGGATQAIIGIGQQMVQFVSLASPATVQLFTRALEDMQGVIGQALTPILELVTEVIRAAADTLAGLAPIGQAVATAIRPLIGLLKVWYELEGRIGQAIGRVVEALSPAIAAIGEALVAIVTAVQPLLDLAIDFVAAGVAEAAKAVASAIGAVVPYVTAFARAVGDLAKYLATAVRELLALLGVKLPDDPGTKPGSSVGAAVKGANVGSIESNIQKAMTSAFSLGSASATPEKRTATAAEAVSKRVDELYAEIKAWPSQIKTWITVDLPAAIRGAASSAASSVTNTATSAAKYVSPGAYLASESAGFIRENFDIEPNPLKWKKPKLW